MLAATALCHGITTTVEEADVFEWWDDGIISQDEAEDILALIDEGNQQEACILAEIYAQESCKSDDKDASKSDSSKRAVTKEKSNSKKGSASKGGKGNGASNESRRGRTKNNGADLTPHGYFMWNARVDSTGHISKHREELQITFYRYTLRLGSQELLTYKAQGYEAHFGDISTREIHSQIPLDTLWGTSLFFPIGKFRIGGLIDTSNTTQAHVELRQGNADIAATLWHNGERNSATVQLDLQNLKAAAWYQVHQSAPLVRIQMNATEAKHFIFSWRTSAYAHGKEIPEEAKLSSAILKNRLWISQTLSATSPSRQTKFIATANMVSPLDADSVGAKFKASAETGPEAIHAKFSISCLDAANTCRQNTVSLAATSSFTATALDASIKSKHDRANGFINGFGPPRIEAGIAYLDAPASKFRTAVIFPKGNPQEAFTLRMETVIGTPRLDGSFIVDFKQTTQRSLHPDKASIKLKAKF